MSRPMYLYHVDDEIVHDVIDGVLYSVPPNEPYEFANPFFGRKFLEHKWFHGVVEVQLVKVPRGWEFQLEDAHERATMALNAADDAYYKAYIETQQQDRLLQGRPAAPPSARQSKILKRQGVNLEEYGVRPVGTKSNVDRMLEAMYEQNQTLMRIMSAMMSGGKVPMSVPIPVVSPGVAAADSEPVLPRASGLGPRNIVVSAIPDVPEPVHRPIRVFSNLDEAAISTDPSELGPEFQGDVNDPNQMSGPVMDPGHVLKPIDLNDSPIGEALNLDETRAKIKIPTPRVVDKRPSHPQRTSVVVGPAR